MLSAEYSQSDTHSVEIKIVVRTESSVEAPFCIICLSFGIQNWLEAHWEPPTIAKLSPCKTALGVTNVQQNGLILFSDALR